MKKIYKTKDLLVRARVDALAISHPGPLLEEKVYLEHRQAHYGLSPFEGQEILDRIDPTRTYKDTKTVLIFGINTKTKAPKLLKGQGLLASISRTVDYHRTLKMAGRRLKQYLELEDQAPILVDSHPLMERALGRRAGLGYIGHNCHLIHPLYGTYLALGLILTKADLGLEDPEPLDQEGCGSCQACIEACPGAALKGGGCMDPFACLSYLSQTKLRTKDQEDLLGPRLYGCDVCQEVCPKNRKVPETWLKTLVKEGIAREDLAHLSNREFKKAYGQLAGAWRGKNQWMKNFDYIDAYWKDQ